MENQNVRFVRIRGRIVPIRSDKKSQNKKSGFVKMAAEHQQKSDKMNLIQGAGLAASLVSMGVILEAVKRGNKKVGLVAAGSAVGSALVSVGAGFAGVYHSVKNRQFERKAGTNTFAGNLGKSGKEIALLGAGLALPFVGLKGLAKSSKAVASVVRKRKLAKAAKSAPKFVSGLLPKGSK